MARAPGTLAPGSRRQPSGPMPSYSETLPAALPRLLLGRAQRQALTPYFFLLPSFLALALVFFYPMLDVVVLSLRSNTVGARLGNFIGLEQYSAIIGSAYFPRIMRTSILWTIGNVVF